jgi:hypothetical protein
MKDDVYFSFQDEAIRKILSKLLKKAKAFFNPDYGLKKSVENETDFLLGVTLAQILDHISKFPNPIRSSRAFHLIVSKNFLCDVGC